MNRSICVPGYIFGLSLTPIALSVYICLCRHVNFSDIGLPPVSVIADECSAPQCDIFFAVSELVSKKLILPSAAKNLLCRQ